MTEITALDRAHAAMTEAPEDAGARLRFYERLADCELFMMLTKEAGDGNISPEMFDLTDGTFVLLFDREERLAQFADRAVPYAALSGRVVVQMLAGQGIGLGLNLEVAPSSILIPAEAVTWLQQTLAHSPEQVEAALIEVAAPTGLPQVLLTALDSKLATAAGLATAAYLVSVRYAGGGQGHLLGFIDATEAAQSALAKAAGEALTFSGIEAGAMDVGFFASTDVMTAKLDKVGLRFDLPQVEAPKLYQPEIPGSNPDKPPVLK
ncbi:MAG: SseB family protein [Rhodobacteraceae bacterium]|nr:SseB family protein [Paracoccaceae bacterium]